MYLCTELFTGLDNCLKWIAAQQPAEIALGLDRVRAVAERLGVLELECPVITVGGTNGKGSTVAALDAIYRAAGYRVGTFTSPILYRHNEYVHINDQEVPDDLFCQAYRHIAEVKGEVALTPFEFHALAALWMFKRDGLDIVILEVGLGGRLDAVNIIDADVAIVTSIDIDHVDWLGETREKIGFEKAGIFRPNKFAICGDREPPASILEHAEKNGVNLFCIGKAFNYQEEENYWQFNAPSINEKMLNLPKNSLFLQNMSCALMAILLLQNKLPVTRLAIEAGLKKIKISARIEIIPGDVTEIYDVSHNPAAVAHLEKKLSAIPCSGKTVAVFSMLADKDINECVKKISKQIDEWYIAPLDVKRSATIEQLKDAFIDAKINNYFSFENIESAYQSAKKSLKIGDRLIIFGSFHTVANVKCARNNLEQ